jgi:hypothetical protein
VVCKKEIVEENIGNMKRSGGKVKVGAKDLTCLFMFLQLASSSKVSPGPRKITSNGRSQSSLPSSLLQHRFNCFGVALYGIVIGARG